MKSFAEYRGEGTFYGEGGAGETGSCMLNRNFNGIPITVAINNDQYEGGKSCGKCVVVRGQGIGSGMTPIIGPIYATIDNVCPECKFGDIDLGLDGDGRFQIIWEFIPCNSIPHNRKYLRK
jgi:hypothetical protein